MWFAAIIALAALLLTTFQYLSNQKKDDNSQRSSISIFIVGILIIIFLGIKTNSTKDSSFPEVNPSMLTKDITDALAKPSLPISGAAITIVNKLVLPSNELIKTQDNLLSSETVNAGASVFAALGTVLTLAFLIFQNIKSNRKDKEDKHSEIAYTKYEHITQRLIDKINTSLSAENVNNSLIFKSIRTTYDSIYILQNEITSAHHKAAAQVAHNELSDTLYEFCQRITFFDLFTANIPKNKKINFKWHNSVEGCTTQLSACWYEFVRPQTDIFRAIKHATYGCSHYKVESDVIYKTLSILLSKECQLDDYHNLKTEIDLIKSTCIINEERLFRLDEISPILFSHLLLEGNLKAAGDKLSFNTFKKKQYWLVSEGVVKQQSGKYFEIPHFKQITFQPRVVK
ncbi:MULTISPECIES: hypothetical protein [unclassified Vibrio]|uniref:hypothetical protein n=1 Tax=unclassified Vibrio TaxID=2614977 RepID=UPI00354B0AC7